VVTVGGAGAFDLGARAAHAPRVEEIDGVFGAHGAQFFFAAALQQAAAAFDGARGQARGHQDFAAHQVAIRAQPAQEGIGVGADAVAGGVGAVTPIPNPSPKGRGGCFVALVGGAHAAVGAQFALETVQDQEQAGALQGIEHFSFR
jgi:hypothetical protein